MSILDAVGAALLLGWDRAVDPGACQYMMRACTLTDNVPVLGWPAVPTRRGLDCPMPPGGVRGPFRRPRGPSERTPWAKRRHNDRREARRLQEINGHRCDPWPTWGPFKGYAWATP